ncbi:hypothetical protein BDV27DRAFT_166975 [Aspergillus caelatus]|uniref:Zn(2)-C6 fungal-type domain-containing protein n=1 Tax=Aspergillus caelatus TaxID=61420 RepID=A0A5N6ZX23_9EURO|nr:uncharacterized protein BDV27DRAFT_166975 [Aspergillus caelatus]KAE8361469.1 hypothetical protein BDV27DRAFT_166975 [Aspergillus caelatus]
MAKKPKKCTRVRTGCYTCKIRRVKCDEARPACVRCTSTGRKCDGYPPEVVKTSQAEEQGALQPPFNLPLFTKAGESMSFDYFRRHTASQLLGCFHASSKDHLILQMCYAEPVIRYAAISLADLHRSFANSTNPNGQGNSNQQHSALVHYASALSHMKSLLCSKIQSIDTFLTACLLLSSIEIFQGRYQAADVHLRCAFHMSEIAKDTNRGTAKQGRPNTSIISKYPMIGTLMRMRFQCDLFLDVASTTPSALIKPGQYISVATPDRFTSLGEAQDILFNQIDRFFRLINQIALAKIATTPGVTSGDVGDRRKYPVAMAESEVFLRQMQTEGVPGLDQWDRAYRAFRSQYAHTFSTPEQHAATLVEIYRDALRMLLQMDHSQGALAHDPFEREFGLLLSRLQLLLDESPQPACTAETPPVFTLEIGIVPILYFIATNCRNYCIRHGALAILAAAPRREGTWDGTIIHTIAQRSVALEEEGRLDGDQSARGIPPSSRLIGMEAGIDPVKQSAFLVLHQLERSQRETIQW